MRFLVDMPLSPTLALWLNDRGHDAVHASDIGLALATDESILATAKRQGRVVVTADLDYPRLLALARATGPGLILFRGGSWRDGNIAAHLDALLQSMGEVEIANSIFVIDPSRVRRRRLPIE